MKKKQWLLLLVLIFLLPVAKAQDEKFKALFMYNFTKYIEWPSEKQKGDFIIGVFGNSPIINELSIIAEKRKVGTQQIVIKKISETKDIAVCNIVYVPESKVLKADDVKLQSKTKGVVVITDAPGLAKTFAGINYVKLDGKQNFEINKKNLEEQGVKVNSALLSLGITIE
jgi:hypothetical protein